MTKTHNYIDPYGLKTGNFYNVYLQSGRKHEEVIFISNGEWNSKAILIFRHLSSPFEIHINPSYVEEIQEISAPEEINIDEFTDEEAQNGQYRKSS